MREDIEKYLGTVNQSTAKTIASRLGLPQLDVSRELNAMTKNGTLEREMEKGEYEYWISRREAPAVVADIPGTSSVPAEASPPAAVMPVAKPVPTPVKTGAEDALAKLSDQTHELLEVLGLPPYMSKAADTAREMVAIAQKTATERDELRIENEALRTLTARLKANNADLEKRIDDLTLGPVGAKSPLFVTVGRYAKPQRHLSLEKAQRRAATLVRGEKESEVLVLEPIGRVVRGSEWKPQ